MPLWVIWEVEHTPIVQCLVARGAGADAPAAGAGVRAQGMLGVRSGGGGAAAYEGEAECRAAQCPPRRTVLPMPPAWHVQQGRAPEAAWGRHPAQACSCLSPPPFPQPPFPGGGARPRPCHASSVLQFTQCLGARRKHCVLRIVTGGRIRFTLLRSEALSLHGRL